MAQQPKHPRLRVQHPIGVVGLLVLVALWLVGRLLPEQAWEHFRLLSRWSAYGAFLAMLVPYLHILRRFVRHRDLGLLHRWLNWHIGAAYAGFFFLLLHCRGRAEGALTLALLVLVWAVMVSGAVGFYGQKLLYRLLPRLVPCEYGLERLEPERRDCLKRAYRILAESQLTSWKKLPVAQGSDPGGLSAALVAVVGSEEALKDSVDLAGKREPDHSKKKKEWQQSRVLIGRALYGVLGLKDLSLKGSPPASAAGGRALRWNNRKRVRESYTDLLRDVPQAVAEFSDEAIDKCLARPFTLWRCLWAVKVSSRLYERRYKRALEVATLDADRQLVEAFWRLVEKRRLLDLEYRLHALGRLWLLFHGPLSLAMLVLLLEHVAMSMRFGGF